MTNSIGKGETDMRRKLWFLKILVLVLAGLAVLSWVVMALWNWLMPALFSGAHEIGYLQAIGVLVLSKILFGRFGPRGGGHGRCGHRRLDKMTPEEREKFQKGIAAGTS
jgi:hypothetical protein